MATRFKAADLKEVIREVVRQEIREVVVQTINEVLSERYLRGLAESAYGARPRGVATLDVQDGDEEPDEDVPGALSNDILGVGQRNPVYKKESEGRGVRQHRKSEGVDRNAMLNLFFEGTRPLDEIEAQADEGVLIDVVDPDAARTVSKWKETADAAAQLAEQRREMRLNPEAEMARIKKMREELDRKVL